MNVPQPRRRQGWPDVVTVLSVFLFLLLAVPSPMVITAMGQVGGPSTLLAFLCFLWWAWHQVARTSPEPGVPQWVRNAALLMMVCALASYARSAALPLPSDERSPADAELIRIIGAAGLVCVLATGVTDRDRLWTLVRRWALMAGALATLALVQVITQQVWVDRLSVPGLSRALNLALVQRGLITRPSGTSTHPIEFAAVMSMAMPLVFAAAARERRHPRLFRIMSLAVPLVVLMTGSRTAIVCGGVAFLVMMVSWSSRKRLVAVGLALLMAVALFVALPGFLGTIRSMFSGASNDPSVRSRTNSYRIAELYWGHHQWLGRGWGTFLPKYWVFDNQYLNLLVAGGVIGLLSLIVLLVMAVRSAVAARSLLADPLERELATAALAGTLAGAFALATFDVFAFQQASYTFFMLIGLCGATLRFAVLAPAGAPQTAQPHLTAGGAHGRGSA